MGEIMKKLNKHNDGLVHWSDCSAYNALSMEPEPFDCGAAKVRSRWFLNAYHLFCIRASALGMSLGVRLNSAFLKQS